MGGEVPWGEELGEIGRLSGADGGSVACRGGEEIVSDVSRYCGMRLLRVGWEEACYECKLPGSSLEYLLVEHSVSRESNMLVQDKKVVVNIRSSSSRHA